MSSFVWASLAICTKQTQKSLQIGWIERIMLVPLRLHSFPWACRPEQSSCREFPWTCACFPTKPLEPSRKVVW